MISKCTGQYCQPYECCAHTPQNHSPDLAGLKLDPVNNSLATYHLPLPQPFATTLRLSVLCVPLL